MNFAPSCRRAASRTRSSPFDAASRPCVRTALGCSEFLFVGRLPSIASSSFGDFPGTTHPSDFSRSFISALRPWPSLRGSSDSRPPSNREISRFPCEKFSSACPALRPRRFLPELAFSLWSAWPSALSPDGVGNRNFGVFSRLYHAACRPPVNAWFYASRLLPMTRGQVGSLLLSLYDISVATSRRSPGAPGGTPAFHPEMEPHPPSFSRFHIPS